MRTLDINDGYNQLLLSWTIDYQPVVTTHADLWARDYQALLGHKMYAGWKIISTFPANKCDPFFNHKYSDPPEKYNTLSHSIPHPFQN